MSDNIVKSEDAAPKKKAAPEKKVETTISNSDNVDKKAAPKKSPTPKKKVSTASEGKKYIYFESGVAYVTRSGFRFSQQNRIYEIDNEEADFLLTLSNFRLPTQIELEDHYKENN